MYGVNTWDTVRLTEAKTFCQDASRLNVPGRAPMLNGKTQPQLPSIKVIAIIPCYGTMSEELMMLLNDVKICFRFPRIKCLNQLEVLFQKK